MIKRYRKKPLEIDAVQFTDNVKEIEDFVGRELDGNMNGTGKCSVGDYIIKGIKGEFYPCKSDIFEASYILLHYRHRSYYRR